MSHAANQARTFLRLAAALRPHWRRDRNLPARIQALLAGERAFGSRDRRLYRELIYTTLRYLPWIEPRLDTDADEAVRRVAWLAADTPATKNFRAALATGEPPHGDKTELLPAWFRAHCPELFASPELETQLRRPPLWLRLQTDEPQGVTDEFAARGWSWRAANILPSALELLDEADVTKTESFRVGRIEIQDLGSQLILETIGLARGGRWLDACAGAGGKTLQLAQLLGPAAQIDAHDIRASALEELKARAIRAGRTNVQLVARPNAHDYDGVLVDAPCSGSGTWRRAPHLKWVTTPETVDLAATQQRALLHEFSAHVRRGGRLIYATCSLSSHENEAVVADFLASHPDFQPAPFANTFGATPRGAGLLILPSLHNSDGFFVACLHRVS
ncbi:MAG TPA: RsmB/NOP family class I SAM-dependent RNA methyltransferase [Opitutaceae bacterium]|nr:RsmB/NOP family class I SAM-dependent RNA methyltransferase [Opitutaceae bacterium]